MKLVLSFVLLVAAVSARKGFGPGEQEWGFSEVRPGAHMFWWLYYTYATDVVTDRPLVLWLQGGPGSSSTGYGNFAELGPLDHTLQPRNFTWVKDCNVMFVDNPVGTGYSYVESNSLLTTNNKQIAEDLVAMMKDFYKQFPKFENTPLYITCESYGGKMVAEFALLLDKAIKNGEIKANFKGVGLGDAWISPIDSVMTWAPYLLNTGMIDQRGFDAIMADANSVKQAVESEQWSLATDLWGMTESTIMRYSHYTDFYNILKKINYGWRSGPVLPGVQRDEVDGAIHNIMNFPVREALGDLPVDVTWSMSSGEVFGTLAGDFMKPVTDVVEQLLNSTDIKVAVFNGQLDLIVDTPGTVDWVERLKWPGKKDWLAAPRDALVSKGIIEGFKKKYGNFAMYWVNRAGHMVPADNPEGMDALLRELTNNYSGQ
ncbi:highroad [Carabus blaptoides fortunei]